MRLSLGLLAALLLSGCASSHVLVGQARAPISAEEVTLYIEPPARYETIALLEASNRGKMNWTDQGHTNTVIWRLKEEAAALGANGIIIQGMGHQYAGSVGSGNAWASGNTAYGVGFRSAITNRVGNLCSCRFPFRYFHRFHSSRDRPEPGCCGSADSSSAYKVSGTAL